MDEPRIIVSLDYSDINPALELARQLDPARCRLKVGKEMFTRSGPVIIERLSALGFEIFLDLKFHDIPNTVAAACRAAADLGVWMINIHAMGGRQMISAAREAVDSSDHRPLLIAVTVLTSLSSAELHETGIESDAHEQVIRLAMLSHDAGADGVVCSAMEAADLRQVLKSPFCLVTPGIRPYGAAQDDQKRIVTPEAAIRAGSDYLVIGRPITRASDPLQALESISQEVRAALKT